MDPILRPEHSSKCCRYNAVNAMTDNQLSINCSNVIYSINVSFVKMHLKSNGIGVASAWLAYQCIISAMAYKL